MFIKKILCRRSLLFLSPLATALLPVLTFTITTTHSLRVPSITTTYLYVVPVKVTWDDSEIGESDVKWKSQRPRFDYHVQVDFETAGDDAELLLEIFDKDKGTWECRNDDFISQFKPNLNLNPVPNTQWAMMTLLARLFSRRMPLRPSVVKGRPYLKK